MSALRLLYLVIYEDGGEKHEKIFTDLEFLKKFLREGGYQPFQVYAIEASCIAEG